MGPQSQGSPGPLLQGSNLSLSISIQSLAT